MRHLNVARHTSFARIVQYETCREKHALRGRAGKGGGGLGAVAPGRINSARVYTCVRVCVSHAGACDLGAF